MPALRPLHLLLLGAAFAATTTLPAAEELIQVTNNTSAKYYLLLDADPGNTGGKFNLSIDGKNFALVAWGDALPLPAQKVANIFLERDRAGKLKHTFFIRDEAHKRIEVQVTAGKTGEAPKVVLPAGAKATLDKGSNIVIGQPRL